MAETRSYYYFAGETVDGNYVEYCSGPRTEEEAKDFAKFCLEVDNGGHIYAWNTETGEFAFEVEV